MTSGCFHELPLASSHGQHRHSETQPGRCRARVSHFIETIPYTHLESSPFSSFSLFGRTAERHMETPAMPIAWGCSAKTLPCGDSI